MHIRVILFLVLSSLVSLNACSSQVIESISIPSEVVITGDKAEIKLEDSSKYLPFKTTNNVRVVKAYLNGKGPFKFMVLFENGVLDPEFITGIVNPKVIEAIGESVRFGKIHHAIKSFKVGEVDLKSFVMEVYAPPAEETKNPLFYLDGAITAGMFKDLKVSFNSERTLMYVSKMKS